MPCGGEALGQRYGAAQTLGGTESLPHRCRAEQMRCRTKAEPLRLIAVERLLLTDA